MLGKSSLKSQFTSIRTLALLEILSQAETPPTLSELAYRTGIPKSTAMRLIHRLEHNGYIVRLAQNKHKLLPGPKLTHFALMALQSSSTEGACNSILRKLVAEIKESCNLTVLINEQVQYIARVEDTTKLRLQLHMEIGARVPLHCTASGKLFLALMESTERDILLSRASMTQFTPKTITDHNALVRQLENIRKRGIGIDEEEFVRGMVGIALPVIDSRERVVAALACHAPTAESTLTHLFQAVPRMRKSVRQLSTILTA